MVIHLQCRRPWFHSWVGKIPWRRDRLPTPIFLGFPCGSAGKESTCKHGRPEFNPWVGKIPWRKARLPTPVFWPSEFHGLYSPWGRKESDTNEPFSLSPLRIKLKTPHGILLQPPSLTSSSSDCSNAHFLPG